MQRMRITLDGCGPLFTSSGRRTLASFASSKDGSACRNEQMRRVVMQRKHCTWCGSSRSIRRTGQQES
eukprot:271670-Amphidinium_carterae.1